MRAFSSRRLASGLLVGLLGLTGLAVTAGPANAQAESAPASRYPASGEVTVRQGDTLYAIASRTLGDGGRYTEVFELNEGVPQEVGGALSDPSVLRVGWVLVLPPRQAPPTGGGTDEPDPDDSPGNGESYTVVAGDSLSSIAAEQLGDASRYDEIFELNEGRPQTGGGTLTDPAVLRVGWVLELPAAEGGGGGGGGGPAPGGRRYTVEAGDSLSSIAADQLGSASRYQEIFDLNEGVPQAVGGSLTDPSVLRVGWVLRLPARNGGGGGGGGTGGGGDTVRQYTVEAGDSLSSIAAEQLGSVSRYQEIFDLNVGRPQAVGGKLTDPSVLEVGWVLRLPTD